MTGATSYPVAPQCLREPKHRTKAHEDTRPSDFASFKEIQPREGLLRLIIGRLITADGQDMQDDYTIPIEKKFMHKPLEWIMRYTYCQARGIPTDADAVKVTVKFMLPEAGAGLGWLDSDLSPNALKLKDSDIVEVLVRERERSKLKDFSSESDDTANELSRQDAEAFFGKARAQLSQLPLSKVWSALSRFYEDDNVVAPGLELLADFAAAQASQRKTVLSAGPSCDACRLLLQLLGELHSGNRRVQAAGWRLLAEVAQEPTLRPRLAQRGGAKTLALRLQRAGDLHAEAEQSIAKLLECVGHRPAEAAPEDAGKEPELSLAKSGGYANGLEFEDPATSAAERWQRQAALVAVKLERAVHKGDAMDIEKALHHLLAKMRSRAMNWGSMEEAGIGKLLGQLKSFDGDVDIRTLAQKAVIEAGKMQQADFIR
eukprot:gb/GFBE01082947.1/.p1 GENE.gb/GFBE01082947.1/~~gb/GFBE01082947.1/.p1  ORF type:complete len:430 (+),score=104.00 gb/GFBE01082947.1/:1-1290(+)